METNLYSDVLKKFICSFIPEVSAIMTKAEKEISLVTNATSCPFVWYLVDSWSCVWLGLALPNTISIPTSY